MRVEDNNTLGNWLRRICAQPNFLFFSLFLPFFSFLILSCSSSSDTFQLKGKFKNFNQGDLFVYSFDGKGRIDTVKLLGGKFSYQREMEDTVVLSVVFPNFSEIPVIAAPGFSIKMEGDASHLREVVLKGSDDNELLTQFRLQVNNQTPPEALKTAAKFIEQNPTSPASFYLLRKYFLQKTDTDYSQASKLISLMMKADPSNRELPTLKKQVDGLQLTGEGKRLPDFKVTTMTGRSVSNADIHGEVNVIYSWATWSYESENILRQLRKRQKEYGSRLQLLGICLDANLEDCRRTATRDSVISYTVCDGRMWKMPVVSKLGIYRVPDVIMTDRNGKIIARGLSQADMISKIDKLLK